MQEDTLTKLNNMYLNMKDAIFQYQKGIISADALEEYLLTELKYRHDDIFNDK